MWNGNRTVFLLILRNHNEDTNMQNNAPHSVLSIHMHVRHNNIEFIGRIFDVFDAHFGICCSVYMLTCIRHLGSVGCVLDETINISKVLNVFLKGNVGAIVAR